MLSEKALARLVYNAKTDAHLRAINHEVPQEHRCGEEILAEYNRLVAENARLAAEVAALRAENKRQCEEINKLALGDDYDEAEENGDAVE